MNLDNLTEKQRNVVLAFDRLGSLRAVARELGLNESSVRRAYRRATGKANRADPVPDLAPEEAEEIFKDLPGYSETMDRVRLYNEDHIRRTELSRHIKIEVNHSPVLLFCVGDLHMDSPGFDIKQFQADMNLIRQAQEEFDGNCRSVFMGDLLDNWPTGGRLAKKLTDQAITQKEALALARGALSEESIDWDVILLGNHDSWAGTNYETLLRQWVDCPVVYWAVFLRLVTEQGWSFTNFLAHDMAGHSMYNQVHAMMRRAREDGTADLYAAGHRHHTGQAQEINAHRDRVYHYLRLGTYKRADEYAWMKGYPDEGSHGATGLAVIDPNAKSPDGRAFTFYDLPLGLDFARMIRDRG